MLGFVLLGVLSYAQGAAQERGFFKTYASGDNRFRLSTSVETEDGGFIVAVNDDLYGSGYSGCAKLFKLSAEGDSIAQVTIDDSDKFCLLTNIFRHPSGHDTFIGTGLYVFQDTVPSRYFAKPYLIQFDGQLNITLRKQIEWPDEFRNTNAYIPKTILNGNRTLFGEYIVYTPGTPPYDYRRLFTEMTLDGDILRIVEDMHDVQPSGCAPDGFFEYPSARQMGSFRYGFVEEGNASAGKVHKLFRLNNDDMVAEYLNELDRFGNDTVSFDTSYYYYISTGYNMLDQSATTIIPLSDTSLLFSMEAEEFWYTWQPPHVDTNFWDHSAVIFKTDGQGNMQQYSFVGSFNDTIEQTPRTSIAATKGGPSGQRDIFHCCYSVYDYTWETPNTLTVTDFTSDLEIKWRKTFTVPGLYLEPHHLITTSDGGCLVVGSVTRGFNPPYSFGTRVEWFALKLNADGTVSTEEIIVKDEMAVYPNPVREQAHILYPASANPALVELYDLQGRLVRSQGNAFESFDMSQLPTGAYTLRVTMDDGQVFSDKVVKE